MENFDFDKWFNWIFKLSIIGVVISWIAALCCLGLVITAIVWIITHWNTVLGTVGQ
jgi:hypothetical protein